MIHELIQAYGLCILFIGIMLECLGIPMLHGVVSCPARQRRVIRG